MRRLAVMLTAIALIAAACSRDESSSSDDNGNTTDQATDSGGEFASLDSDDFGTIPWPCGPNEGGGDVPSGDPDETQGVSDDSIKVSTIADPGYEAVPGLNQEMFDIAEAYTKECNSRGGINGKKLDLTLRDSALFEYTARVEEACAEDFSIVGAGAVFDDTGAQQMTDCGLIEISGFNTTAPASLADNVVQPVPNPPNVKPGVHLIKLLDELENDGAGIDADVDEIKDNAGLMWGETQTTIDVADQYKKTAEALGFNFVYESSYNIMGESNWTPFVAAMQEAGVEFLYFVGSPDFLIELQEAMDEFGYAPKIIFQEANFYDQDYAQGIEGLNPDTLQLVRTVYWPFERADQNTTTQIYLDLLAKYVPDGTPANLGEQALSAWLLFSTAAQKCDLDDDLTRSCVFKNAKVDSWTGGGLHTETSPADFVPPPCGLILQVDGGTFDLWRPEGDTPDDAFFCDEDGIIEIQGDYGEGVKRQT